MDNWRWWTMRKRMNKWNRSFVENTNHRMNNYFDSFNKKWQKKCHWRRKREHKFIRSCRNISESINQYNLSNVRGCGVRKKVVRCQIKLFNNKHRQNGGKIGSKLKWWIKMCAVQWLRKNKVKTMKRVSRFSGNGVCV